MATIDQLGKALINADAAGDVEAAKILAAEIKRMQTAPKFTPREAKPEPSALMAPLQGFSAGVGNVMFGGQKLLGMGLEKVGATDTGRFLQEDAARRQAAEAAKLAPYKESSPFLTGAGQLAGEVVSTLPVGGALAAPIRAVGTVAPTAARFTAPLATAVESSGFTRQPTNMLTRTAGGGISGGVRKFYADDISTIRSKI